jgi:hypothetical protein
MGWQAASCSGYYAALMVFHAPICPCYTEDSVVL